MSKKREFKPRDWREGLRIRAWELKGQGWTQSQIAAALGVSTGAVSQWLKRAREGGVEALHTQPRSGRPPKLTEDQRAQLPALLARGAEAYGLRGDLWTTQRVAWLIEREFGVRYHPASMSRLLRAIGWSLQKPGTQAIQRDEEAIEQWLEERWPKIKKKPNDKGERSSG